MKLGTPRPAARSVDDSMLPLINLVFLLMVFVLLLGAVAVPEVLPVQPPQATALRPGQAGHRGLLIAADGRLALDGEVFGAPALPARAAAWARRHPGQRLQVKADARFDAGALLRLLHVLREAGIEDLRLLAEDAR